MNYRSPHKNDTNEKLKYLQQTEDNSFNFSPKWVFLIISNFYFCSVHMFSISLFLFNLLISIRCPYKLEQFIRKICYIMQLIFSLNSTHRKHFLFCFYNYVNWVALNRLRVTFSNSKQ